MLLAKLIPALLLVGLVSSFNVNPVQQNADNGKISVVVLLKAS